MASFEYRRCPQCGSRAADQTFCGCGARLKGWPPSRARTAFAVALALLFALPSSVVGWVGVGSGLTEALGCLGLRRDLGDCLYGLFIAAIGSGLIWLSWLLVHTTRRTLAGDAQRRFGAAEGLHR